MAGEDFRPSIDREGRQGIVLNVCRNRGKIGAWWHKSQQLDPRSGDPRQLYCGQVSTDMQPDIAPAIDGRLFSPLFVQWSNGIDGSFECDRTLAQWHGQFRLAEAQDRNEEEEKNGEELIHLKMAYG